MALSNEEKYLRENRRRDRLVSKHRSTLRKEIYRASEAYSKSIQFDGSKLIFPETLGANSLIEDVRNIWQEVTPLYANRIVKEYAKKKFDIPTVSWHMQEIQQYFYEHYEKISSISLTTKDSIDRLATAATEKAIASGEGIGAVMSALRTDVFLRNLRRSSKFQAERIARTEVLSAQNFGQHIGSKELAQTYGIEMMKTWLAKKDNKTRDAHMDMNSNIWIPANRKFNVGDTKMLHPGDRNGGPSQVINCRCVADYLPKDELELDQEGS